MINISKARKRITVMLIGFAAAAICTPAAAAVQSGIVIDGEYADWNNYPHSDIQLTGHAATGALYIGGDGYVYGHTVSAEQPGQDSELGGIWRFYMSVNDIGEVNLHAALVSEGTDRQLHFAEDLGYAANMNDAGACKYYIVGANTGLDPSTTLEELEASGLIYGVAYAEKSLDRWEMEYKVDIGMLAKRAGLNGASDVKIISSQFYMLGSRWVTAAGTSTGAAAGICICLAAVFVTFLVRKRKAAGCSAS